MIGRCRDCKYFRKDKYGWFENGGDCMKSETEDGKLKIPETLAMAIDSETYRAYLDVSPDFGCVQFEEVVDEPISRN